MANNGHGQRFNVIDYCDGIHDDYRIISFHTVSYRVRVMANNWRKFEMIFHYLPTIAWRVTAWV